MKSNKIKKFKDFSNKNKRVKFFLNGHEMWIDKHKLTIYEKEDSREEDGIYIFSNRLTNNERKQVTNFLNYN